eukprot:NODE_12893_length_1197_cov_6.478505.p2 GENE.NODE_12893_length_1197_cov_6.478505~~NODE_12893_length_1197_cov_6.478505.p2  ORF type:complete len:277 (+),score=72.25 NODE_12893_length_1197_cov_6.478505:200-1030(+)
MEARSRHADTKFAYRPEISEASRMMVSGHLDYIGETFDERINRLAVKDLERREQARGALELHYYRDCTFQPAVNATSSTAGSRIDDERPDSLTDGGGAAHEPVHERLYRSATGSANRSRCSEESQMRSEKADEEHHFTPQLDASAMKRYAHVRGHYSRTGDGVMTGIRERTEKREQFLNEQRLQREEQELAACTFAPGTLQNRVEASDSPIVVNGLGRFFELCDLSQRQQREQADRESKVFLPDTSKTRTSGTTIPEPFALSQSSRLAHHRSAVAS